MLKNQPLKIIGAEWMLLTVGNGYDQKFVYK